MAEWAFRDCERLQTNSVQFGQKFPYLETCVPDLTGRPFHDYSELYVALYCFESASKRKRLSPLNIDLHEIDAAIQSWKQVINADTRDVENLTSMFTQFGHELVGYLCYTGVS